MPNLYEKITYTRNCTDCETVTLRKAPQARPTSNISQTRSMPTKWKPHKQKLLQTQTIDRTAPRHSEVSWRFKGCHLCRVGLPNTVM